MVTVRGGFGFLGLVLAGVSGFGRGLGQILSQTCPILRKGERGFGIKGALGRGEGRESKSRDVSVHSSTHVWQLCIFQCISCFGPLPILLSRPLVRPKPPIVPNR